MALNISCPFCQYAFPVSSHYSNKKIQCPQCAGAIGVVNVDSPGAEEAVCPLCAQALPKDADCCKHCGCDIRTAAEIKPRTLPEIFHYSKAVAAKSSHGRTLFLLTVLLALAGGMYYFKSLQNATPILSLLPDDTKIVVMAHWKNLAKAAGDPTLAHWQSQLLPCISSLLPDSTQVQWQDDIELVCLVGNEPGLCNQILEKDCRQWQPYVVLLTGNFPSERWQGFAAQQKTSYHNMPIWQHARKTGDLETAWFFTIFGHNTVAISQDIETIKHIINVRQGISPSVVRGFGNPLQPASESCLLQVYGQFPARFFPADFVANRIAPELGTLSRLYLSVGYHGQRLTGRLEANFGSDKASQLAQASWDKMLDHTMIALRTLASVHADQFDSWRQKSQVQMFKHKLTIEFTGAEISQKLLQFLLWLDRDGGYVSVLAQHKWQSIANADMPQKETLVNEFLQDSRFANSPLLAKVKEVQQSLHKENKESEAQSVYLRLTQNVAADSPLLRWDALQQFPNDYEGTVTARQVNQQLEEAVKQLQRKVEETNALLKKLIDGGKNAELQKLLASEALLSGEQLAILKKAGEQVPQLMTHVQVLHKLQENALRESQKSANPVAAFLQQEFPAFIARRDWDKAVRQVRELQAQLKSAGKAEEPGLAKALQEAAELKSLFVQAADVLGEASKQKKTVAVATLDGDSHTGIVLRVSKNKDKFELRDTQNQSRPLLVEKLTARTLNDLIAAKDRKAKVCYYLGLLALHEGRDRQDNDTLLVAKKNLSEAKKLGLEAAGELLKTMEK